MDEINPLENQLQSWTPRRPSPRIARRLFGAAIEPSLRAACRVGAWNWFSPAAAFVLTMLVAVQTANLSPGRSAQGTNSAAFDPSSTDFAAYSLNHANENLEWNIWPHATDPVPTLAYQVESKPPERPWSLTRITTNR